MISLVQHDSCIGCGACMKICAFKAIEMLPDDEGFLYPNVDSDTCKQCGQCLLICPIINYLDKKQHQLPEVWSAWNLDQDIRMQSSSGGVFYELALSIIKRNGVVYGAVFDPNFRLQHKAAFTIEEINPMMGSKYVQSEIIDTFTEVYSFIKKGVLVLYSGTPCQVAALYSFLGEDFENLITCDVICHGVASPGVFQSYIDHLEKKNQSRIVEYKFRKKISSWKNFHNSIKYNNGFTQEEMHNENIFMKGYLNNLFLRPVCYDCKFSNVSRISDITLGDFWGIWKYKSEYNSDLGVSALISNTNKGYELIKKLPIIREEAKIDWLIAENPMLNSSVRMPGKRELFFKMWNKNVDVETIINKCIPPASILDKILYSLKKRIKKVF
jgi:coenzyme F420-reducing hydrogenase beta subunit